MSFCDQHCRVRKLDNEGLNLFRQIFFSDPQQLRFQGLVRKLINYNEKSNKNLLQLPRERMRARERVSEIERQRERERV